MSDRPGHDRGTDVTGSVGEEAVRLLQALQDWARDRAGDGAPAATGAPDAAPRVDGPIATGAADCRHCPVCQVISLVRGTSPEVRSHLAEAATSLMHAAAGLLATPVPDRGATRRDPVQKIDLDGWEDD